MYLIREMTQLSTTRIGAVFGGRDHTTVMHACDKVARLEKSDEDTQEALARLRRTLGGRYGYAGEAAFLKKAPPQAPPGKHLQENRITS